MTKMQASRRRPAAVRATAHHEAGHAVAALVHSVRIEHVTVGDRTDSVGHICYAHKPSGYEQVSCCAIVILAGEAAQWRFNPRSVRSHHHRDDRLQAYICELECLRLTGTTTCLRDVWKLEAAELVEANWPSVQRIAAALVEHGTLDHEGCHRLMLGQN